jgi:hypothetical protein
MLLKLAERNSPQSNGVASVAVGPSQAATFRSSIMNMTRHIWCGLLASVAAPSVATAPALAQKKPNIVMLMTDDTGWNDFGCYTGGGAALGHPTPNIDRIAKEGACSPAGTDRRVAPPAVRRS